MLVCRTIESNMARHVMENISSQTNFVNKNDPNTSQCRHSRQYTVHISATDNWGVALSNETVIWKDRHKRSADASVADLLCFSIQYSHVHGYTYSFSITGYTAVTLTHNE